MHSQIAWPVVVLSQDNTFLHIADDEAALCQHVLTELSGDPVLRAQPQDSALDLGFFDMEAFCLRPRLGRRWLLSGLDWTAERVDPAELMRRMAVAVLMAQEWETARLVRVLIADGLTPEAAQ